MKNKNSVIIVGIVILILFAVFMSYSFNVLSFAGKISSVRFIATTDTGLTYYVGDDLFKHSKVIGQCSSDIKDVRPCGTRSLYDGKVIELSRGQSKQLNNFLDVMLVQAYEKNDEQFAYYIFSPRDVEIFSVTINDNQQKLVGNDMVKFTLCNKAGTNFNGGFTVTETFENGVKVSRDYDTLISDGCKEYSLKLNFSILGRDNVEFFPYINLKNVNVQQQDVTQKVYVCQLENGDFVDRSVVCPTSEDIYDIKFMNNNVFVAEEQIYKVYDSISWGYPYIVVQQIKEVQSVRCETSSCPSGYDCTSVVANNQNYKVCLKKAVDGVSIVADSVTDSETDVVVYDDESGVKDVVKKYLYMGLGVLFGIVALLFFYINFFVRRNKK